MKIDTAKFEEIIENITKNINLYERIQLYNNHYTLFLANGEILNIKFLRNNIPHLLGVNIDYLKLSNKFKPNASYYDNLNYFVENSFNFRKLVNEGSMSYSLMFSSYVDEKNYAFEKNSKIRTDDMFYIVKYDREKTYKIEPKADICEYYIIRRSNNKYYVLGLMKNENLYLPVSSRVYDDEENFDNFMARIANKQEITYAYSMSVKNKYGNYNENFVVNINEKEKLINRVIKASEKYDATASVVKDYSYFLNRYKNEKENYKTNITILSLLSDSIKSGNVFEVSSIDEMLGNFELNDDIKELINVCNNMLCGSHNNEMALNSYSEIEQENKTIKQELITLRNEVAKLADENESLKNSNSEYDEQLKIYDEAYQKVAELKKSKPKY